MYPDLVVPLLVKLVDQAVLVFPAPTAAGRSVDMVVAASFENQSTTRRRGDNEHVLGEGHKG